MVLKRLTLAILDQFYWPLLFGGTVFVCQQFPYRGNDMIHAIWIIPIALCHTFCLGHWPIGPERFGLSFIWGHHHLYLVGVWMISRPADYFINPTLCWRGPRRSKQPQRLQFLAFSLNSIMSLPRRAFYVVTALHHCFHRKEHNGLGAPRGQRHIPSKNLLK